MMVGRCGVQEGDQVLVHAAGSGVSVAVTQIAKHFGARVVVTAGSNKKLPRGWEMVPSLGCITKPKIGKRKRRLGLKN